MYRILFIITGSIAAGKCLTIIDKLVSKKFKISCVLTKEAKRYVKIDELKQFAKNRIFTDNSEKKNKMLHINLSRNNDLIIVCPATANTIAKFANGYGDNLASNILLASNKKILFVPAMNSQMWLNKANQKNIYILRNRGYEFIGPKVGNLKCGEFGLGRISDSKEIIEKIIEIFKVQKLFQNKKCLVTAGPTIEMIDPIRYISNQSSGKQGYEIASQLSLNGAKVTLISGPTNLTAPSNIKLVKIKSAKEMYKQVQKISNIDYGFFTAAVSDFKNKKIITKKIKKNDNYNLDLVKNIDILKKIGNDKKRKPKVLIGFAAETGNVDLARKKLIEKNCDIIVYNKITNKNNIFGSDYNKISIITKNKIKHFYRMTKINCAKKIIDYAYSYSINK